MAIDASRVAAALRGLADAIEGAPNDNPPTATAAPAATPKPRGRPPKGGSDAPPAAAAAPAAPAAPEADPFASPTPAAASAPAASLDDVRAALTRLRAATTQENALKVLKDASGVDNLTALAPAKYGVVVAAANAAIQTAAPAVQTEDPFGSESQPAAEKPATLEDVKAACVEAAKRTSQASVLKVIFEHGGKAPNANGVGEGASLKALPEKAYAATIAAIKALPTTK